MAGGSALERHESGRNAKDVIRQPGTGDPMQGSGQLDPAKRSEKRPAVRGHLERGWVKHRLIRDFALGEKTGEELAKIYGCSGTSISAFKKRHAVEIEECRNHLADEYAGLWVAEKMKRIAEYQEAAEKMARGASPRNQEVLVSILKAVAEELGQLPTRAQVNVSNETTVYQVVGISEDDI